MNRSSQLRIAAIEPYFGGSHRHFLLDLQRHSRHRIDLFTLPPRMWKWRIRGSSLQLARELNAAVTASIEGGTTPPRGGNKASVGTTPRRSASGRPGFDLLLCSDFVNLPDLRALLVPELRTVPVLCYMHENQMTYPLSPEEEFDPYFGFTNVLSCLSAEAVAFNSEFHRGEFFARLPGFLPRLPDYQPRWVVETIAAKSEVLPLGLDVAAIEERRPEGSPRHRTQHGPPLRILWNHRWEFDKRPELFFAALEELALEGVPFVVDVLGESFARRPEVFDTARERLAGRLGRFGYVESREEYLQLLWAADIAVSTASQEFFGIALAEATLCGAHPIAPRALVYEELYGGSCDRHHLYREGGLAALLRRTLTEPRPSHDCELAQRLRRFDWQNIAPRFDERFESLAGRSSA